MSRAKKLGRVVYLMTLMALVLIVLGYMAYYKIEQSEKARLTDEILETIHTTSLEIFKNDADFFTREIRSRSFFASGESPYLTTHTTLSESLQLLIAEATQEENMNIDAELVVIAGQMKDYDATFQQLVTKLFERGLENTGTMGRLEAAAQQLLDRAGSTRTQVLQLRLLERDFLLLRNQDYFDRWKEQLDVLRREGGSPNAMTAALDDYRKEFERYVAESEELGLAHYTGLREKLNDEAELVLASVNRLSQRAETFTLKSYSQGSGFFLTSIIVCIGFLFALMILIVKNII